MRYENMSFFSNVFVFQLCWTIFNFNFNFNITTILFSFLWRQKHYQMKLFIPHIFQIFREKYYISSFEICFPLRIAPLIPHWIWPCVCTSHTHTCGVLIRIEAARGRAERTRRQIGSVWTSDVRRARLIMTPGKAETAVVYYPVGSARRPRACAVG
jgi:hypothetical protein